MSNLNDFKPTNNPYVFVTTSQNIESGKQYVVGALGITLTWGDPGNNDKKDGDWVELVFPSIYDGIPGSGITNVAYKGNTYSLGSGGGRTRFVHDSRGGSYNSPIIFSEAYILNGQGWSHEPG